MSLQLAVNLQVVDLRWILFRTGGYHRLRLPIDVLYVALEFNAPQLIETPPRARG